LHRICAATVSLSLLNDTWLSYSVIVTLAICTRWTTTTPTTHRALAALRAPALCPRRLLPLCGRLVRRPAALKWVWVCNQPSLAPAAVPTTTSCQLPACNLCALNFNRVHSASLANCPGGVVTTTCYWIYINNALSAVDLVLCLALSLSLGCAACFSLLSGRAESCDVSLPL